MDSFSESYHENDYAVAMDPVDELIGTWRVELPSVLGPESELIKRVLLLAQAFGDATAAELPELGLTNAEYDVLAALRRAGTPYARKPIELTKALMLSSGGISNVINRLEARGLVERQADPADGRGSRVLLTPVGVELAERALKVNTAAHAAVVADVSQETLTAAADALRAVFATAKGLRRPGRRP